MSDAPSKRALVVAQNPEAAAELQRLLAALERAGFQTTELDVRRDLAEQVEEILSSGPPGDTLLFTSGPAVLSDGVPFVCVDPADPTVADAIEDLVAAVRDVARGRVACLLELRLGAAATREDPFAAAQMVTAARSAVRAAGSAGAGIPAIVACYVAGGKAPAPLASAVLAALEQEGDVDTALLEVRLRDDVRFVEAVQGFTTLGGATPFVLRAAPAREAAPEAAPAPPAPKDTGGETPPADAPPEPRASLPSVEIDEVEVVPPPPPPPRRPASVRASAVVELPAERSFRGSDPPPAGPRVVVRSSQPPPAAPAPEPRSGSAPAPAAAAALDPIVPPPPAIPSLDAPPPAPAPEAPARPPPAAPSAAPTFDDVLGEADRKRDAGAFEDALTQYKRALAMLPSGAASAEQRARVHEHMGELRLRQGKRREAIAAFEKAAGLFATPKPGLLVRLLELNLEEHEYRSVATLEDKLVALSSDAEKPMVGLVFARRWARSEHPDHTRAVALLQAALERFKAQRGSGPPTEHELDTLDELAKALEGLGRKDAAFAMREARALALPAGPEQAQLLERLGNEVLSARADEATAISFFRKALEAEPSHLSPLATIARILADRQEWAELELAYRSALSRVESMPDGEVRRVAAAEIAKRLGLLLRDHLEDPPHALEAFETALAHRPDDEAILKTAVELARSLGETARGLRLLQLAASLEPSATGTFHAIFEAAQKERDNELAFSAAQVAVLRGEADARERIIFEEHDKPDPPRPSVTLSAEHLALLSPPTDPNVEAIFEAISETLLDAIHAELGLSAPDPGFRVDPAKTTVFSVRAVAWAAHCIGVPAPHVYLDPEAPFGIRELLTDECAVLLGSGVTKGRTPKELAFMAARHVYYHVGPRRLLLHLASVDELSSAFLAAVGVVLGPVPVPSRLAEAERRLRGHLTEGLAEEPAARARLERAVRAFDASGSRTDLGSWVAAAERGAARLGLLFSGDLRVAASVIQASRTSQRGEPLVVAAERELLEDLAGFVVGDRHRTLREALGLALPSG